MASKYPYVPSPGPLVKSVDHLRKSFPRTVTADTFRKLGVAPKNETYVINVFRFLGVIDDDGKRVTDRSKAFMQHEEEAFATEFGEIVCDAYEELFDLHGDAAWKLDRGSLTQFFRNTDHTSDVVGSRQAVTFATLAALSGYADVPAPKASSRQESARKVAEKSAVPGSARRTTSREAKQEPLLNVGPQNNDVGLTVRIEVNLPANGDQETYDRIFRSIRKNLIDG